MKMLTLILAILLSSCASQDLAHLLNDFELLAETTPTSPPLNVRILKLRDNGECNNSECQKEQLYIAVSEFGEHPKQIVYLSQKRDSWAFVKWIKHANFNDNNPTAVFRLKSEVGSNTKIEDVSVNLKAITYKTR